MPAKITDLPTLADLALTDVLPVVDDPLGTPATKKVTVADLVALLRQQMTAVGDVLITVVDVNPSARFGGTWVKVSQGRALVGVDPADADFDAAEKVFGAKTVTLDTTQLPPHSHPVDDPGHTHVETNNSATTGPLVGFAARDTSTNTQTATGYSTQSATTGITLGDTGGGQAHNNVQPSFTVFVWKRTA
jgi:microcystin-dependent protein